MRVRLKGCAADSEKLKTDTTPSFQFLALLLDLVARDNDKCIEHISEFCIFPRVSAQD